MFFLVFWTEDLVKISLAQHHFTRLYLKESIEMDLMLFPYFFCLLYMNKDE